MRAPSTGILVLFSLVSVAFAVSQKALQEVAEYIEMLHEAGSKHYTIFDLLGVSPRSTEREMKSARAHLMQECNRMKKRKEGPFGPGIDQNKSRVLVLNGFKILSSPELRRAYEWILQEAPPHFMEEFRTRRKEAKRLKYHTPPAILVVILILSTLFLFDLVSTFSPYYLHGVLSPEKSKALKKKKEKKRRQADAPLSIKKPTFWDTFTARAYIRATEIVLPKRPLQ